MKQANIKAGNLILILGSALAPACTEHAAVVTTARERTHLLLLSAVYHADKCGDTRPLVSLLATIPDGSNKAAMARWMKLYTAYDFKKQTKKDEDRVFKNRPDVTFTQAKTRDAAAAFPYYAMPGQKAAKSEFSVKKFAAKIAAKIEKEELTPAQARAMAKALMTIAERIMPLSRDGITPATTAADAAAADASTKAKRARRNKAKAAQKAAADAGLPATEAAVIGQLAQAMH